MEKENPMTLPRPLTALRAVRRTLGALSLAALPLAGAAALTLPLALQAPAALAQDGDGDRDDQIGQLLEQAMEQLQAKDYDAALQTYATVLRRVEAAEVPEEAKASVISLAHYNSACALSLQGKKEQAIDRFEKALEAGFNEFDHIDKDTDLDAIRGEKRFKDLMARWQSKAREEKAAAGAGERKRFLEQISKDALFPFDFDGKDVDGNPLRLSDMRGKVVLVDVWGTWCPPCRAEVPHLAALHKKLEPRGFGVMGLACERVDAKEAPAVVRKFLAEQSVPYPSASVDKAWPSKNIPDFEGFPTLLLVDRAGKVRMKVVGYTEGDLLEAAVAKLLDEAPAPEGAKPPAPAPTTPEAPAKPKGGAQEF